VNKLPFISFSFSFLFFDEAFEIKKIKKRGEKGIQFDYGEGIC
jgi:hypothetical protein